MSQAAELRSTESIGLPEAELVKFVDLDVDLECL